MLVIIGIGVFGIGLNGLDGLCAGVVWHRTTGLEDFVMEFLGIGLNGLDGLCDGDYWHRTTGL